MSASRFLRKLLGIPDPEPEPPPRERLFPDQYSSRDLGHLLGMFDPSNIGLYIRPLIKYRKEQLLIRHGQLEEAAAAIKTQLFLMNAEERLSCALLTTNDVHELRHAHDYFGTVTGFNRFLRAIEDGVEFAKMWSTLVKRGTVRLPLHKWADQIDAPPELKAYRSARREYVEWVHATQGSMDEHRKMAGHEDADVMLLYQVGGLQVLIPAAPIKVHNREGASFQYLVPLGTHAIMESVAFIVQRAAINRVFGKVYSEQVTRELQAGSSDNTQWLYYLTIEQLARRDAKTFFNTALLALADLAMMPGSRAGSHDESHPGHRLSRAMAAARAVAPIDKDPGDTADYMNRLAAHCGWEPPAEVVKQRLDFCGSLLAKSTPDSFWGGIIQAAARLHQRFMEIRERFPALFAEPSLFFTLLETFSDSPVWVEGSSVEFWGLKAGDATAFRDWYFFEHFIGQMWFETSLPCPSPKGSHRCPGDPLTPGWKPNGICAFAEVMAQVGIAGVKVEIIN